MTCASPTFAKKRAPSERQVITLGAVPGAVLPGDTAYAVAQALAWLARQRNDLQEQLEWKRQIPELMAPLVGLQAA